MTLTNLGLGWKAAYGTETVTLARPAAQEPGAVSGPFSVTVERCKRYPATKTQLDIVGHLDQDVVIFALWSEMLGGKIPKQDDEITDAGGVEYRIIKVDVKGLGQRYECFGVRK